MSVARTTKSRMIFLSFVLAFVVILSTEARADLYPFEVIQPPNSTNAEAMAMQLSLDIVDLGGDPYQVDFRFYNNLAPGYEVTPGEDGIITGVAFEDGTLFGMGTPYRVSGTAVVFQKSTASGTWGLDFDASSNFFMIDKYKSVDNGVNPGEALGIVFDLQGGNNFSDVITALELGFTTSNPTQYDEDGNIIPGTGTTLRIGIHVQNLEEIVGVPDNTDESDTYILTPIPASVVLGMLGLGVAGLKLRRFE